MTLLWTILIAAVALALLASLLLAGWQRSGAAPSARVVAGLAAGLAGAAIIVVPRMDIVPDDLEPLGVAVIIMLGSLGLIVATWLRAIRH